MITPHYLARHARLPQRLLHGEEQIAALREDGDLARRGPAHAPRRDPRRDRRILLRRGREPTRHRLRPGEEAVRRASPLGATLEIVHLVAEDRLREAVDLRSRAVVERERPRPAPHVDAKLAQAAPVRVDALPRVANERQAVRPVPRERGEEAQLLRPQVLHLVHDHGVEGVGDAAREDQIARKCGVASAVSCTMVMEPVCAARIVRRVFAHR